MRSTTLLVLDPRGKDSEARSRARAALDDGTLSALLGADLALDRARDTLVVDRRASLVEHGSDVARIARDVSVFLSAEVTAVATIDDAALVVARALPQGTVARALWPPSFAARASDLSDARAFVEDDHDADRLTRALDAERLLPEEVLPEIVSALALPLALPLATFAARRRGLVDADVFLARDVRTPRAPTLRGPSRMVTAALRPFTVTFSLADAPSPVSLALTVDEALVVDVVRLVGDDGERVAPLRPDGVVVFPELPAGARSARVVIEGVARAPASTTLVVEAGRGARAVVEVAVRPPPQPLFGVTRSHTRELAPFLLARAGGRDVVLATLARDEPGFHALSALLATACADAALRWSVNGAGVDAPSPVDLVHAARAGQRVEARANEGRRLSRTVVVATPPVGPAGVSETIVVVASGDDGASPPPFSFDDVIAAASRGGVHQAASAAWTWDAACSPFTTPYEAALGIPPAALAERADARTRLRGVGANLFAAEGPLGDALLAAGGAPMTGGAALRVAPDERATAERRLARALRPV